MKTDLLIGMAGSGGDGVVSAGESLITAATLDGYYAVLTKSFGPQIRGGESSFRLGLSPHPLTGVGSDLDVAVALNWDDFLKFKSELRITPDTVVIYDSASGVTADRLPLDVQPALAIAVPIEEMAKNIVGSERGKNTIVMGLMAGWFSIAPSSILAGLMKRFGRKSPEILERNQRAFEAGRRYAEERPLPGDWRLSPPVERVSRRLLLDGNEMCAAAALHAGCDFFSGYPITPSSEIMQFLGREMWKYGGVMLQAEDEIAGIGAVVGASFAGKKAMTATSGPGMSLKTEMLGLATIAELPLVCINVQRGGPSTGMPTKGEQGDLYQAAFSSHGDALRPVLAPTTVADTFFVTVEAFNIAEEFQTPVIVLSDQDIAQRKEVVAPFDTEQFRIVDRLTPTPEDLEHYVRFRNTPSGISPLSHPGMEKGNYLASGIEHDENGAPTARGEIHDAMNAKRFRKLDPLKKRRDLFLVEGDRDAELALVSWGGSVGAARDGMEKARSEGLKVKLLVPYLVYPVAEEVYRDFFLGVTAGLVIEQSFQGQLYRILRMFVDVPAGVVPFCRSGANPFNAREVLDRLRKMAGSVVGVES
jgi:2-oxoglutarate ferredoxin oxidoreductase subunit alpha